VGKGGRIGMLVGLLKSIAWEAIEDIRVKRYIAKSLRELSLKKLTEEEFIKKIYREYDEDVADEIFGILYGG